MKVIFLDFDGVLNGYNFFSATGWKIACFLKIKDWYSEHTRDVFGLHKEKIRRLSKIVKKTNAKVVLSATLRGAYWRTPDNEKEGTLKDLKDECNRYGIDIIGITPKSPDCRRDKEILQWLSEHEDEVDEFVILDDENVDLQCFIGSHLVQTSSIKRGEIIHGLWHENTGLRNKHVKQAIKILNRRRTEL